MSKPQFAILRFAKYKGPEISNIEAHNERTKEDYASNPDIDKSRSHLNFHLLEPERKYRAEAERQIKDAGCRTRSDSVRLVEALVTATPDFFKGKKKAEIKAYFQEALDFIREHQDPKTIISAVVHMDEKTPHMHLSFVPLTADGRLSAKEIVGNKKKLTQWQDRFWEHMVKKYPDLERGESAGETGRDHIPPRVFKEMTRLTKQKAKLEELLAGVNAFNAKGKAAEIGAFLDKYIPTVEQMHTTLKKYNTAFTATTAENKKLKKKTEQLEQSLDKATQESTLKKLADAKLHRDYEDAVAVLDRIPKEVLAAYTHRTEKERETAYDRLYKMYDKIEDTENQLVAARAKKMAIEAEKLTGDNIYKVLIYFDKLYSVMDDQEKRQLMESLLSEVQIYEERQPNGQWLKSIKFRLPIIAEDMSLSLDNDTHIEAIVSLQREI